MFVPTASCLDVLTVLRQPSKCEVLLATPQETLCVCVCMYVYIYIYIYLYLCVCVSVCVRESPRACVLARACACVRVPRYERYKPIYQGSTAAIVVMMKKIVMKMEVRLLMMIMMMSVRDDDRDKL